METRNNLLMGQIALDLKLITQQQLEDCLLQQAGQVRHRGIGALLVENGFLTEAQLAQLLGEQRRRMRESVPYAVGEKEDMTFGRLLIKHGYTTAERVNEALRAQQDFFERGQRRRLGELLQEAGHITIEDARAVLSIQGKVQRACTFCGRHYNVLKVIADQYPCRSCAMPLGDTVGTLSADETAYLLPSVPMDMMTPKGGTRIVKDVKPAPAAAAPQPGPSHSGSARQLVLTLVFIGLIILLMFLLSRGGSP